MHNYKNKPLFSNGTKIEKPWYKLIEIMFIFDLSKTLENYYETICFLEEHVELQKKYLVNT